MPLTADGARLLTAALVDVDEDVEQPLTVWLWDVDAAQEVRGSLWGWADRAAGRSALVVFRQRGDAGGWVDVVRWLPDALVRERRE